MSAARPASISGRWRRATAYEFTARALRSELDGTFASLAHVDDRGGVKDQLLIIAAVASRRVAEIHSASTRSKASA